MSEEQIETRFKKGRGMARASLELIEAMRVEAEAAQPITGRGIGYKLFVRGLIPSMGQSDMQKVYRLLKEARERGMIPWEWIVDETRELERVPSWNDPSDYADTVIQSLSPGLLESAACARPGMQREGHGSGRHCSGAR